MNATPHQGLTLEKWRSLPLDKQLLNIASELTRARNWIRENNPSLADRSIERTLELIDLTLSIKRNDLSRFFTKEFLRLRESLCAIYVSPDKNLKETVLLLKNLLDLIPPVHNLSLKI